MSEKKQKNNDSLSQRRLTKEQLEAIRGGVVKTLPNTDMKPVFYTVPKS